MNDLARLEETVDCFCEFIAAVPASALVEQDWGPKKVLAHLVYYDELYVSPTEALLAGTPPTPPQGRFRDLNAKAVTASRGIPPAELVDRLREANQRPVKLYQQHDPNKTTVEIKAGAKMRTMAKLVPEVEAHVRNHLERLRQGLNH